LLFGSVGIYRRRRRNGWGAAEVRGLLMPDGRVVDARFLLAASPPAARIVTYNVHKCVGTDRRYDPERVAAVLREIDADIACLQEVAVRRRNARHVDQCLFLAEATQCYAIPSAIGRAHRGRFGNAILTRFPVLAARSIDLTVAGWPARGAIDADLLVGDRVLRVIATHFGLGASERRLQTNRLLAALAEPLPPNRRAADAVLLMGDLNEWRGSSGGIRALDRRLGPSAAAATFPSWLPMLPLDRIYVEHPAVLSELRVYRSPLARVASDHLPLVGGIEWSDRIALRRDHRPLPQPAIWQDSAAA
jgi:endonuclease/exonuclease/phosphatase family metal-dependent hydrolase